MNIAQIKAVLVEKGILVAGQKFDLRNADNEDGTPTDWMRHWNNDKRIGVSVPKEVVAKIQADPIGFDTLVLKTGEEKTAASGSNYTSYQLVAITKAPDASF